MNTQTPIRVMVVDDSAFMRKAISSMLRDSPDIVVVDTAKNGEEALQKVATLDLDVAAAAGGDEMVSVLVVHDGREARVRASPTGRVEVDARAVEEGAGTHQSGLWFAPDLLRHQRHLHLQQDRGASAGAPRGHRAGGPGLPQVASLRSSAFRRPRGLSGLLSAA